MIPEVIDIYVYKDKASASPTAKTDMKVLRVMTPEQSPFHWKAMAPGPIRMGKHKIGPTRYLDIVITMLIEILKSTQIKR